MKKLLLVALLLGGLGVTTPGCLVRTRSHSHGHVHRDHGHRHKRVRCSPNEYWDGHRCRHKGRGHGARKHDRRY